MTRRFTANTRSRHWMSFPPANESDATSFQQIKDNANNGSGNSNEVYTRCTIQGDHSRHWEIPRHLLDKVAVTRTIFNSMNMMLLNNGLVPTMKLAINNVSQQNLAATLLVDFLSFPERSQIPRYFPVF